VARVRITATAERDLTAILEHVESEAGRRRADALLGRFRAKITLLIEHPMLGAQDDRLRGRRRLIEGPYLIVYRLMNDEVRVVRVVHGARDLDAIFPDETD